MKTEEFRCGKCNKLLAKFVINVEFENDASNRTFIVEGEPDKPWKHHWYLEIKCPQCDKINKMPISENYAPIHTNEKEQMAEFYALQKAAKR